VQQEPEATTITDHSESQGRRASQHASNIALLWLRCGAL
jgi:hypothetical protein